MFAPGLHKLITLYDIYICTQSPSNQRFYRQIAGHQKGGGVSGVG